MPRKEEGPDQARSWAIAMAGCVINSLLSGISRTTGLYYVALIETYGVTRMEANMPFTLRNVVRNLASPITGAIGQRYGARDITFIGGVFASLGIALCCFAPNVTWISVLWGGMHGLGVALGNTLFPVIINQYFLKHRATASGLSLSGACIGSFILPIIMEYLLYDIGLPGTFLISGSLILHVLPAAILMTEPSWMQKIGPEKNRRGHSTSSALQREKAGKKDDVPVVDVNKIDPAGIILNVTKKAEENSFQPMTRDARVFSRNGIDNPAFMGSKSDIFEKTVEPEEEQFQEMRIRTISVGESSLVLPAPASNEVQETSLTKGIITVISDPMFHVISISLAGFAMLFDPAITVIVDYIKDKGLEEDDAKYFISMMSLGDLLGRLCFGWVTDRKYMTAPKFMLLLQVVQGICFILLPLFHTLDLLLVIIVVYGVASGASLVMYPILVSKYLSSVQSLAIGSISICTGVVSFAVPPLIGYFRDNAGSYDGMFIITGSLSILAGCLWLFEPLFVRLKKSHHSASITANS